MRLFTAIEIPAAIGLDLERLKGGVPNARWIDRENYHLTLAFIGEVDRRLAADIDSALANISRLAFELRLEGIGSFGGDKPRTLWAGVSPEPALFDLQAEIAWSLSRVGAPIDSRKFAPHVTLARFRGAEVPAVASYLSRQGGYASEPFDVGRFTLMSSRPSKGGGPYLAERVYPLLNGFAEMEDEYEEVW